MAEVTTVGEALLRLSVPAGTRIVQATSFDVALAGAELNVAAALAAIGRGAKWFGALPRNPLGSFAARRLRELDLGVAGVHWAETGRLGTYYVELAHPPRPVAVTYDRKDSAAARMTADVIDWHALLDTRILHLTGITPALSDTCRELTERAMARAREEGVPVSFDVNHRNALWSAGEAAGWIDDHARDLELVLCAERDARRLFGLRGPPDDVARALWERLRPRVLVLTRGGDGALSFDGHRAHEQAALPVTIADRLGAGDAFAAGVLDGWLDDDVAEGLRRGSVLASLALAQRGDQVVTDRQEVDSLLQEAGSTGSIRR